MRYFLPHSKGHKVAPVVPEAPYPTTRAPVKAGPEDSFLAVDKREGRPSRHPGHGMSASRPSLYDPPQHRSALEFSALWERSYQWSSGRDKGELRGTRKSCYMCSGKLRAGAETSCARIWVLRVLRPFVPLRVLENACSTVPAIAPVTKPWRVKRNFIS